MSNFAVTSSPHLRDKATTQRIMMEVCLALAPAGIAGIILYGFNAALLIAICVATCVLSEFVWQKATKQPVTIADWSAVVTGMLLAYNLPSSAPWWIAVVGSVIAIILVKQMFGGIGSNFMNPALTARAILFVSWSTIMATYPTSILPDAVAGATPLNALKNVLAGKAEMASLKFDWIDLLLGNHGGVLGETCAIAIILGGVYLLIRGIADWRIPVSFIVTTFVCFLIKDSAEMAVYQLLSGGLLLGAFFMATDYATSPITGKGRIVFGIGCGVLTVIFRYFGIYPEGVTYAILLMNAFVWVIDRYTAPRRFGVKKGGKA